MKCVSVGRVTATHGLKGEVKFWYYNHERDGLYRYTSFLIKQKDEWIELKPEHVRFQKDTFYIKFSGYDGLEKVTSFINKELFVREEDLPGLEPDEYYEYQLIGLDVINQTGRLLGKVDYIMHTRANDVMVVKGEREILIPMVDIFISSIDIEHSIIKVEGDDFLV
ncbi:MAG: 16S rRNA processing protein RimM [Syntrophorhabdaceae bacterium]|nr:16S rRNA processing protein RimM [Syntrophorhabdales bacterium]MBP9560308.1 16S rRNA processing protein RimM [Syntrophorhabdaceae bacterium]